MSTAVKENASRADPGAFLAAIRNAIAEGGPIHLEVNGSECVVDREMASSLSTLVEAVNAGRPVNITSLPAEVSTGQAADLLGVSRPTVVSLIDKGVLPATRLATHRRLRVEDVLAYQAEARLSRRAALDDLAEVSQELGLYDN